MPDTQDMDLVREFARHNSEAAFTELVRRHIALVHSVARRCTGNDGDAQDVTQAVFIILARKAAGLRERTLLSGWLYETTRFTAARLRRANARRQQREQEAYMQSTLNEPDRADIWEKLSPHLEAAMSNLAEHDRALLVLRFYQNKSGPEAAVLMGIREDTAHKRVARAIEKLRTFFAQRGVTLSGEAIAGAVSAHSVHATPVAMAKTISAVALAKGATASASTLALAQGALKIMAWTKAKTSLAAITAVVLVAGATALLVHGASLASIDGTFRSVLFKHKYQQYAKRFEGIWEGKIAIQMNSGPWTQYRRFVVKVLEDHGAYHAVVDEIDDGRENIFVPTMTLDKLAINFTSDSFSYHGVFHKDGTEIHGVWKSPIGSYVLVLTRTNNPDTPAALLTKEDYTPRPGSDLQGVWKTVLTNDSTAQPVYLKIAEATDGTLRAECENLGKRPVIPLPVTDMIYKKPQLRFGAWAMGGTFNNGVMNESNSAFAGQWHQIRPFAATKNLQIVWTRVNPDDEELALPAGGNFEYKRDVELQGHWSGTFPFTSGVTLNLDLNIARLPDGAYSATLDSPDQRLFAMPADVLEFKPPKVRLEMKDAHCTFEGRLMDGKLSGDWSFQDISRPIVLERKQP